MNKKKLKERMKRIRALLQTAEGDLSEVESAVADLEKEVRLIQEQNEKSE